MESPRINVLAPRIDSAHGFVIGSPQRQHWQLALLAGLGAQAAITVMAMMFLMIAMVTLV